MITEQTKEIIGEILYSAIRTAVMESRGTMTYDAWNLLDPRTKANYMAVVERMGEAFEKGQEPTDEVPVVETTAVKTEPIANSDSSLLPSLVSEGAPVTLAPKPPPRKKTRKRKVASKT